MKKTILLFFSLLTMLQLSLAQRTVYHTRPEKLFNQGKEMFLEGNYAGAEDLLAQFTAVSNDTRLKEEAAYMRAVASFKRGREESGEVLQSFLDNYPESVHRHPLLFLIGSRYFDQKEWEQARTWFALTDLDYLTLTDQEDYSFRSG
ncbi:MAG: tetratricopeptide repeat protein, partial [Proteiniphilum sp.]|nr:tetratricopeptide repeat protein [Proteiniphilum sp.]